MNKLADINLIDALLQNIQSGVWVWNIDTGEEWWSDNYYRLLGYEPGELTPSYHTFIKELLHADDFKYFTQEDGSPILRGVAEVSEMRLLCKNKQYRWFEATARLILDEQGKPEKMIGAIIDIHEKKLQQTEWQQTIEFLNRQNQLLSQFAYTASHNLRSYSNNLKELISLYHEMTKKEDQQECIDKVEELAESLSTSLLHLNEMLKYKNSFSADKKVLYFEDVCKFVLSILEPAISKSQAKITTNFTNTDNIFYIYASLESILLNLISNAIKYKHPERIPEIHISTVMVNERTQLIIIDNGQGIDLEKYGNRIFKMYQTFHENIDAKGIGLYLIKNQIESLGGTIRVESEVGKGSTFTVSF